MKFSFGNLRLICYATRLWQTARAGASTLDTFGNFRNFFLSRQPLHEYVSVCGVCILRTSKWMVELLSVVLDSAGICCTRSCNDFHMESSFNSNERCGKPYHIWSWSTFGANELRTVSLAAHTSRAIADRSIAHLTRSHVTAHLALRLGGGAVV